MNLQQIRDAVYDQVDWEPDPTEEANALADRFINRALYQMVLDAPFCFHQQERRIATQPDVEPTLATDTLTLVTDTGITGNPLNPWVFQADLAVGTTDAVVWKTDRSWDARTLVITVDGVEHTRRIRTIWINDEGTRVYISIEVPWDKDTYGSGPFADWKVQTDTYFFPDDVIEYKSCRAVGDFPGREVKILSEDDAETIGIVDRWVGTGGGPPRWGYRRHHEQIPGPNVPPSVGDATGLPGLKGSPKWLGPDVPGQFEYCVTYCWGKRDTDWQNSGVARYNDDGSLWLDNATGRADSNIVYGRNRFREPLFESAPSPVSDAHTVLPPDEPDQGSFTASPAVAVTLPNITFMLGFLAKGTVATSTAFERLQHTESGWHVRIYRRRLTAQFTDPLFGTNTYEQLGVGVGGQHFAGLNRLDIHDAFFLLAEFKISDLNEGIFIDDGTLLPDYNRRLREVHGYQSIRWYPKPDARYEMALRVVARPQRLISVSDTPPIHEPACEALIHLAVSYMREHLKDYAGSQVAEKRYWDSVGKVRKRYGNLKPGDEPTTRRAARVRSTKRSRFGRLYPIEDT